ncbi:MAG: Asp-tRNA(Asn)/Glu-tRNA(Gln) amidotransferase subunit GatB [Chloroflexi bacterium]|nr:Asp-tRNA(Asn)/Glu-tRNA(Gln) amidotransferase subunit GatB [Chloroflexota bacterium]
MTGAQSAPPAAPSAGARWEAVIGIEVHCQLRTASKMFCACSSAYDGAPPNTHTCPVCLGLPGALPTINRQAVAHVLTTGLAIGATTPPATRWDRKNYFYPDLPKGYQISQFDLPLAAAGRLAIETSGGPIVVGIQRAHLEEDTAKLVHATTATGERVSLVDFNRSGVPLMEIVTEPDIRTAEQARRYAEELQLLLRAIGVSDADMERGQMRVEANVSLRPVGSEPFGTRTEVKNMNSFRAVERAIAHEIERQAGALDAGEVLAQETRGWDDGRGVTYVMRSKEDSHDYRYFPEPDLPPLRVDPAWLDSLRAALPELPAARRRRYVETLGLSSYDAAVIVADPRAVALFDVLVTAEVPAKQAANWVSGEYLRLARKYSTDQDAVFLDPVNLGAELAGLIKLQIAEQITLQNAKEVFGTHLASGQAMAVIVGARGLRRISDDDTLRSLVAAVLAANPKAVTDHRAGRPTVGFLVGKVMKETGGQAHAERVRALLIEELERIAG